MHRKRFRDEGLVQDPRIKEPEAVQEMLHIDPERETVDPEPFEGQASIFHHEFCKAVKTRSNKDTSAVHLKTFCMVGNEDITK